MPENLTLAITSWDCQMRYLFQRGVNKKAQIWLTFWFKYNAGLEEVDHGELHNIRPTALTKDFYSLYSMKWQFTPFQRKFISFDRN